MHCGSCCIDFEPWDLSEYYPYNLTFHGSIYYDSLSHIRLRREEYMLRDAIPIDRDLSKILSTVSFL